MSVPPDAKPIKVRIVLLEIDGIIVDAVICRMDTPEPDPPPPTVAPRQAMEDRMPANDEMVQGYLDGFDLSAPEPSANRSHSYRHGFANGRDDLAGKPRATAQQLRQWAAEAMGKDACT